MDLEVFNHEVFGAVRAAILNNEPHLLALDVCNVLGYANPRDAVAKHVDSDDVAKCDTATSTGIRLMTYINESGLYSLIFGSKLETARQFKKWVTSEVLPSIRKKGGYIATQEEDTPEMIMARALIVANEALSRHKQLLEQKSVQLALTESELQKSAPKVQYYEEVLQSDRLMPVNVIANDLGISAQRLNHFLKINKVIYCNGGCYLLTAKFRDKEYAHTRTFEYTDSYNKKQSTVHLYWTEKGREFIIGLWNKHLEASTI